MTRAALRGAALAACAATLASASPAVPAADAPRVLVHAGTLLAVPGQPPLARRTLVIEDGRVAEIREGFAREPGAVVHDLSGAFVMPGWIDLHTHLTGELGPQTKLDAVTRTRVDVAFVAAEHARRTLAAGFTTVRDVGGEPEASFGLRDAIAAGRVDGPRILAAGYGLSGTGGHADAHGYVPEVLEWMRGDGICDGADDCRRAVRAQVRRGADWIKITATGGVLSETAAGVGQQMFDDELRSIVETATTLGRRVAAHAHGADGIVAALRAGVRTIEHGTYSDDEAFRLFREKEAWLVPTLLAGETVLRMAEESEFLPGSIAEKAARVGRDMKDTVRRARAAGVRIAFGTDSGVSRHGDNAREFELLVESGLTPMEALAAATVEAAAVLEMSDRLGTLEPGKLADVVALGADPLADIAAVRDVRFVMRSGRALVDRAAQPPPSSTRSKKSRASGAPD